MDRLDTTGWPQAKKEAYEQYLSKVRLEKELEAVMERILSEKGNQK
jgi:hypothetical protein